MYHPFQKSSTDCRRVRPVTLPPFSPLQQGLFGCRYVESISQDIPLSIAESRNTPNLQIGLFIFDTTSNPASLRNDLKSFFL
jgi:hypothetical protein